MSTTIHHPTSSRDFYLGMLYTDGDNFQQQQTVLLVNDLGLTLDEAQEKLDIIGREDILAEQWGLPNLAPYRHEYCIPERSTVDGCYVDISELFPMSTGVQYECSCLLSDVIRNIELGGESIFMTDLREAQEGQSDDLQARFDNAIALIRQDGHRLTTEQRALLLQESIGLRLAVKDNGEERRPIIISSPPPSIHKHLEHSIVIVDPSPRPQILEHIEQLGQRVAILGGPSVDSEALILAAREKCMSMDRFIVKDKNERPRGAPDIPSRKKVNKKARRMHR